jgi:DNA-binding transcriptional LysR family regulator
MSANELRDVELRHLAALRAVAETRSFGRAAELLGYTQSAVSQQIAALEKLVGEPVFERPGGPRPVELTRAGEVLLGHAEVILDRLRAADADLAGYRAGRLGRLSIGTFQSVSVKVLPDVVRELRQDRPDLQIELFESDLQEELLRGVANGDLDLSFIVVPPSPEDAIGVEYRSLSTDPFVLLSPGDEALSSEGAPVPVERLRDRPIIGQTVCACQTDVENGLRRLGVDPRIVFRTSDNSAVQALVRAGMGHAVMPLLAIDPQDPGVAVRDLDPPLRPRTIGIAVPTRRHRAPVVEVFTDIARRVCASLAPTSDAVA